MPILMIMGLTRAQHGIMITLQIWFPVGVVAVSSEIGGAFSVLDHTLITMGFCSATMDPLDWSVLGNGSIGFGGARLSSLLKLRIL